MAATVVEAGIVMFNRHGAGGARKLNALIREAGFQIESVTAQHAQIAVQGLCFIWQRAEERGPPELRRLLFIRFGQGDRPSTSVQGSGFQ